MELRRRRTLIRRAALLFRPRGNSQTGWLDEITLLLVWKQEEHGKATNYYGLLWWNNADETIEGVPLYS